MEQSATIYGVVPSKSNSYRIVSFGGHSSLAKTTAMKKYEESFMWQAGKLRDLNIDTPFEYYIDVYFPSKRSDLDGCLKATLDCLQKVRAISNDNNCCKIVARKFIDKKAPRIEIMIKSISL
jgi:Holliday junction resolvase RusA-like endonuclease